MGITGGLQAEAYDRSYSDAQLLRRIGAYFRPHAGTVALVALTVALGSLAATVLPLVISRGINALTGNPTAQIMLGLAGLVTVLGALGWLFNFIRQWLGARAVGDVVLTLRQDAMAAVLRRDMSFFDQYASGRIVSRVSSDTQDFSTVITLTIDLLSQLVLVSVIAAELAPRAADPGQRADRRNSRDGVSQHRAPGHAPIPARAGRGQRNCSGDD
jgi:ATP-binding cassette, subfamily B, bacterial